MCKLDSPLNHKMATIIHRAADTSCTIAWIAVTICAGSGKIWVSQSGRRGIVSGVNVEIAAEARRG
jgi:hypothetical protein